MKVCVGLDFGTSGARAIALSPTAQILNEQAIAYSTPQEARDPLVWKAALFELIGGIPQELKSQLEAIAINGTSSTVLLCDVRGQPLLPPMMYGDNGDRALLQQLETVAPPHSCVLSASSSLVKLLTFQTQPEREKARYFLHQADWLAFLLHGQLGISDYHNSLKLGYDPATESYPAWFAAPLLQPLATLLPKVLPPGSLMGRVSPAIAARLALPLSCQLRAGTTDSIAAFLASGAVKPGEAVTSLGSTLVLKLLSQQRVDCAEYGIYSHRLGHLWLAGGASNTGGAVLARFFSVEALTQLSQKIDPTRESLLHYYPLLTPGERFPVNQPDLQPQLEPRPADDVEFLQGLLDSMARIEAKGYALLERLGASPLQQVLTAGGGAKNEIWRLMRQRHLKVPVCASPHQQAAYGTALLAAGQSARTSE
ncbi:FGGY-family carbohydrate kinase [Altericista sp. CCNU0014]|uniref:FGGY-family carbohydrate kinase n=1 Tax=Altericista sp. CCNU0014 TaxID=3082949 RepID=UPI00384DF3A0